MSKSKNAAWRFFASVKLALVTLIILAVSSIIGTIIEQKKAPSFYVEEYGANLAILFEILNLDNMYNSWWFLALLSLFAVNLVVCSIERLPGAWRMVVMDNLALDSEKLNHMSFTHRTETSLTAEAAADRMHLFLSDDGWKNPRRRNREEAILLFAQKGAWTRLGVYAVHLSVLVILTGAIIGSLFGFKAYVFLPEGRAIRNVFLQGSSDPVPLNFEVLCDRFERSFYPNGQIREYRSDLTIFDPKLTEPRHKSIIVNDPLTHRGITFYQGDSYPLEEYLVVISSRNTGMEQAFRVPAHQDIAWPGTDFSFRIDELELDREGAV
jgi:cytochrome c biogenesis protein